MLRDRCRAVAARLTGRARHRLEQGQAPAATLLEAFGLSVGRGRRADPLDDAAFVAAARAAAASRRIDLEEIIRSLRHGNRVQFGSGADDFLVLLDADRALELLAPARASALTF